MSMFYSVVLAFLFLISVAVPSGAQNTLKIGAPQPMTGPDAPFGSKFKKAYDLALEEINAKGGVQGKKIEVIIEDHQAKNPLAATVTEKLIAQYKVLALTGGRASGQAVEIASVAQRLKTPYIVDHPSADIITAKGFEWVFRNNPTGSIYPQAFNKFISEVPGAMPKSAAVVYDNTVFGKTIANSAMVFLNSKKVPIVNDEANPVNTLDFKPLMTKVKAQNPDFLLMVAVSTTDAILLTRQAKEMGVAPRAFVGFGGGFGVADIATELGPLSENVFSSAAWSGNPNDPATKAFYKKFFDKYGFYPKEHEVEGYAVIYIIADAFKRAKFTGKLEGDRDAVRQALLKTDMTTVFGKVKFGNWKGPLGDPYTNQNIYSPDHSVLAQWRGGKLLNVYPKNVAETE
ncbi:MAG: branched-chain amino acid transporter substrate-binding protein, partial [Deltaproteobacteria bacterium]|nr:branched-chain amino acid transporter substrate-binding protein [Deltaproteobacteria bacterium]